MHEYPKGHPMWRAPRLRLSEPVRSMLVSLTVAALRRQLGEDHPQIGAFLRQAPELNNDRLASVASENGVNLEDRSWR